MNTHLLLKKPMQLFSAVVNAQPIRSINNPN